MQPALRHATQHNPAQRFCLWLLAAMAILLVVSVLEAGHIHGAFAQEDTHCTLCQHSVALDQTLAPSTSFVLPRTLSALIFAHCLCIILNANAYFARIRAPPLKIYRR
jgi:hypothetical protein